MTDFFVVQDCRELYLRKLEGVVRQSRISTPVVIDAFSRAVGETHDELAAADRNDGFDSTAGLTASRISLVGFDDLEIDIRIGEIANRLKDNEQIDRWRVQLRYMTLLNRPKMSSEDNPLGLEPICRGLAALCKASTNTLEQNLDQLALIEQLLQAQLPEVYSELNDLLAERHVESAPVHLVQRPAGGRPPAGQGFAPGFGGGAGSGGGGGYGGSGTGGVQGGLPSSNALSSLQQAMHQQFAATESFFEERHPAGGSGSSALNASALVMLNHLMDRLNALELERATFAGDDSSAGEGAPHRSIRAKDLDLPLGKPAAIALDTLSLIFEAIFAAPDLPDVIKSVIGRLQIPLLRLAIVDTSFFADSQHPARRLINRMARAAIGLAPDAGREHPLCASLAKMADAVRVSLEKSDADLSPHLDQLDTLIAQRDQALQDSSEPYRQLVAEHENRAAAVFNAQDWTFKAQGKTRHAQVARFFGDYWRRVMELASINGGTTGADWKECAATGDQLLASVRPQQSAEERKQLLSLIPALLKRINDGLDRLDIPSTERTLFLNAFFHLQTAALRSRPETPGDQPYSRPAAAATPTASAAPLILEREGKLVHYLGQPSVIQSPWRSSNAATKEGDWISFSLPDGEHLCGRHCGQLTPTGTVLLFNDQWGYAVALAPAQIEQRARVVSDTALFDDAAEQALSQINPS